MGHQAGFQEAVVDLYRDKKISVILANEVIDVLLLRIDTEINHGALANVLNMALFPVLEQEIRSHVISLLLAGFAWTLARDVPSRVATGTNAPARLSGASRGLLAHLCGVAVANFLGIPTRPNASN